MVIIAMVLPFAWIETLEAAGILTSHYWDDKI
jgi:hypothetical protein